VDADIPMQRIALLHRGSRLDDMNHRVKVAAQRVTVGPALCPATDLVLTTRTQSEGHLALVELRYLVHGAVATHIS
jgi:hypothetical protein